MTAKRTKPRILFICTGNSIRSQMAEAFGRKYGEDFIERVASAGVMPSGIHPLTVKAMKEIDFDLTGQQSKSVNDLNLSEFGFWVTLCDHARQFCPLVPETVSHEHWSIEDPISAKGSDEDRLEKFREVRDELRERVQDFLNRLRKLN